MSIGRSVLICLAVSLAQPAHAAETPPLEYQVKAAFLLNFTKFIDWPTTEASPPDPLFRICILGEDPFGPVLDQMLAGETFHGRKLTAERVRRPPPAYCRILFAGKPEKDVAGLLAGIGPGVLTVGEGTDFLRAGGMIGFVIANGRVRFEINESAAARAGLRMSSKLLMVAKSVEK